MKTFGLALAFLFAASGSFADEPAEDNKETRCEVRLEGYSVGYSRCRNGWVITEVRNVGTTGTIQVGCARPVAYCQKSTNEQNP